MRLLEASLLLIFTTALLFFINSLTIFEASQKMLLYFFAFIFLTMFLIKSIT